MDFQIIEYTTDYEEQVKDLLLELQEYIANLDKRNVLIVKENYRNDYFLYLMSEIEKHNGRIFVAVRNSNVFGMIACKIFQGGAESDLTTSCPKIGFISDLVVTKDKRRQGVGKLLINTAEEYFSKNECEYTQLEVFAPNVNATEVYKKLGFEVNCYYMSKRTEKKL